MCPRSPASHEGDPLLAHKLEDAGAVEVHESRGDHHQRLGTRSRGRFKGPIELLGPPDFEGLNVDAKPTRGRLGVAIFAVGMIGVPEHCDG